MISKPLIETLGPIRQLGFLTRDIHASMAFYSATFGIGPWFFGERAHFESLEYLGRPSAPDLAYAVAAWGDLQLELMEPRGAGPSAVHAWMDRDYSQLLQHHVAIWPEDLDAALAAAADGGFEIVQDGTTAAGRFLYLINPANPECILEITHSTPPRRAFNQHVVDAAAGWDGSRPVRPFGVIE